MYTAEIDAQQIVQRVIVAPDPTWPAANLGGIWVGTSDPYAPPEVVTYAGIGMGEANNQPELFATQWVQPVAKPDPEPGEDPWTWYNLDEQVFHNMKLWRSLTNANTYEPGVASWRETVTAPGEYSPWLQPSGSTDAYKIDDKVTHDGQNWNNVTADNVWEPGVFGWEVIA